ncbi:MAG: ferrochelatase [Pseudomonadota bacterium]
MSGSGVLLINLGTPDAPTAAAIRRFLRQFLSDRRVVQLPRVLWLPILYGFILPFRPGRLAQAYQKIWRVDGSPLLAIAHKQAAALRTQLKIPVALGMCYGTPSIADALAQLRAQNVEHIVALPLYPQYSDTTTAAALDCLPKNQTVSVIRDYHAEAGYIAALAESVREHWQSQGRGDHLLMSFHGIPQSYVDQGDPYETQCRETAGLLARALSLKESEWSLGFQSRLGRAPWLKPYTDVLLPELAARGIRKLDVICPGFSADCLETLEEVSIRYAEDFGAAGGTLRYIAALNERPAHIAALAATVTRTLAG